MKKSAPESAESSIATELERQLRAALRVSPSACPQARLLAESASPEGWTVAAHVAECSACAAVARAAAAPIVEFPTGERGRALTERARSILSQQPSSILRLAIRAIGRTLQVLDVVGEVLEPAPVRGEASESVMVRHRFAERDVAAHVSCSDPGRFAILLDVFGPEEDASTLRLSLFRGGRELASEIPRSGRVLFPAVKEGRYRVVLADQAGPKGEMDLTLSNAAS